MTRPAWASSASDDAIASWVASVITSLGDDRMACARVALSALVVVSPLSSPDGGDVVLQSTALADKRDAVARWISDPTAENQWLARHLLDPTRQLHAWSDFAILTDAWILETADFALHAVWSGSATWYLAPPSPRICAELAAISASRAFATSGESRHGTGALVIGMAAQLGVAAPLFSHDP